MTDASKPWLASYPKGVPETIDPLSAGTIADAIDESTRRFASRPAFESFGKRLTFDEVRRASDAVLCWLQAKGFVKGDRIAIMMPNVMAYPVVMFAVLRGGYTVVNVNPLYTPRELEHQLNDSGAKALVVLENFAHVCRRRGRISRA